MSDPLRLVKYPDWPLTQACAEWDFRRDREPATGLTLYEIAARMFEVMYDNYGCGLAANQVGLPLRIFVADPDAFTEEAGTRTLAVVNPVLHDHYGEQFGREGCLSVHPGVKFPVRRAAACRLTGFGLDGRPLELEAEGLGARLFQHEVGHLDGEHCLDLTDRYSREVALKKLKKFRDGKLVLAAGA